LTTVLVVEDGITDGQIISRYLQAMAIEVILVESSEAASNHLIHQAPDLIILDVILPGQSGFELCYQLKNQARTRNIPVVICSSKHTAADQLLGNMLGADGYLAKPIEILELQNLLGNLLTPTKSH
jgi:chemotaxis family two-component system response regulator PixH